MKKATVLLFVFFNTFVFGQSDINQIDILEYKTISEHKDLAFLNEDLKDVQIVGVGESTHGTREFNLFYLKMFKYLVEVHDYNTLFLEDEFVPCSLLDEYVKCEENCDSLSASVLTYWPWQTEEMTDLIEWIKAYNESNRSNKLSIVGMDVQDSKSMYLELNSILKESNIEPIYLAPIKAVNNDKKIAKYRQYYCSADLIDAYQTKLDLVDKKLVHKYTTLIEYMKLSKMVSYKPKKWHLRDLSMAKNVLSYLTVQPKTKGMIIAHNGHLFKFNKGKKNEMKNGVLAGGVLDKKLGDKYYFIMQDFDGGCFNAYKRQNKGNKNDIDSYELTEVCIEKSIDKAIGSALRNENKTITFITENDLFQLMGTKSIRYHEIGAVFRPLKKNPNQTFSFFYLDKGKIDACIFHQSSTATTLLKTNPNN